MKLYFKRGVVIGFIITILTIGGLGIYAYVGIRKLIDDGVVQSRSLRITNYAERLLVTTIDLETGQRGFIVTGDSIYLEPYDDALKVIDVNIELLVNVTAGDLRKNELVSELKEVVKKKTEIVKRTVEARKVSFEDARKIVLTNEGKHLMDKIRALIARIQSQEAEVYDSRNVNSGGLLTYFQFVFTGALFVPAVIVIILFYNINSNLNKKQLVTEKLQKANLEVTQLNRDLESFTYSVSHDLRAPLRSVNGYANILIEDYGDQLDDEAKRVIGVIAKNGRRMGQLIDDLLNFSRLGRKDLQRTSIPMQNMVATIVEELKETEYYNPNAKIFINPLPNATGDLAMIRQVWENLISNGLKYSGNKDNAVIEIGAFTNDDEQGYYVKDNGVGFNMQYVGKLFGVFQRLHKNDEFEGTGVGLALTKRIIDRHKGKVWAEGKLNEGATFYFSLPV